MVVIVRQSSVSKKVCATPLVVLSRDDLPAATIVHILKILCDPRISVINEDHNNATIVYI